MQLEARKISFRYHPRQPWVLKDLEFGVGQGECVGLFAPSGYGKTTLAMLLAGYLKPVEGEILLAGRVLPLSGVCPGPGTFTHLLLPTERGGGGGVGVGG